MNVSYCYLSSISNEINMRAWSVFLYCLSPFL